MTLRAEYAALPPAFNAFLFAPIGDEESGVPLTVLSALARIGMDPWKESERLSLMPRKAAADALAASISRLRGRGASTETSAIASRLVELLPRRGAETVARPRRAIAVLSSFETSIRLILLAVLGIVLFLRWWISG
jgi:hypothetical protein